VRLVLWLQLGTLTAVAGWAILTLSTLVDRMRHDHARRHGRPENRQSRRELVRLARADGPDPGEWHRGAALVRLLELHDPEAEDLARAAIRGTDGELRYAAITALGRIGGDAGWAVDLLLEALAEGRERAARIAAALERCAPAPGDRLPALLSHPSAVVRCWTVRLLARYPEHRRAVARLRRDPDAQVRAAVLETLRATAAGPPDAAALRLAVELLEEGRAAVRHQAVKTIAQLGNGSTAPLLAPLLGDASWTVRLETETALAGLGAAGAIAASGALTAESREAGEGAVRVLQATGVVDRLAARGDDELLDRVRAAGGGRVETTAGRRDGDHS